MALTPSTMLELGTPLPPFRLPSVLAAADAPPLESSSLDDRPVLVLFLSAHCPYVKHIEAELSRLAADYGDRIQLIGIASNSLHTHPQDGPDGLRAQARSRGWTFPYLHDATQSVARAFQAACTPDPFLFDSRHHLVYRGQLDGSRPGNAQPCDGHDLRAALDAVLSGQTVNPDQRPSIGCNIKWHPQPDGTEQPQAG
ncbi:MAG: thioredoxin family protein [Cyanobacteriota bacterium]